MLQIGGLFLDFFQLVLGIYHQFGPYVNDKRIGLSQTFLSKSLKLVLGENSQLIALYLDLVLLPLIYNMVFQEFCSKKYTFLAFKAGNLEMILVLLIKVVVFHMQIAIIKVSVSKFEKSIKIFSYFNSQGWDYQSLNPINKCYYKPIENLNLRNICSGTQNKSGCTYICKCKTQSKGLWSRDLGLQGYKTSDDRSSTTNKRHCDGGRVENKNIKRDGAKSKDEEKER